MPENISTREIEISDGGIRLGQLLKFADLVDSGSDAKEVLADGLVRVNDAIDSRRGRQLQRGDVITLGSGPTAQSVRLI